MQLFVLLAESLDLVNFHYVIFASLYFCNYPKIPKNTIFGSQNDLDLQYSVHLGNPDFHRIPSQLNQVMYSAVIAK